MITIKIQIVKNTKIKASKKQGHYILKYSFNYNMRIHCAIEPETIDHVLHPIITYTYVINTLELLLTTKESAVKTCLYFVFSKCLFDNVEIDHSRDKSFTILHRYLGYITKICLHFRGTITLVANRLAQLKHTKDIVASLQFENKTMQRQQFRQLGRLVQAGRRGNNSTKHFQRLEPSRVRMLKIIKPQQFNMKPGFDS